VSMYDLHLHSTYSDGDLKPADLIAQAVQRGVKGVSLTDHNGIWGIGEITAAADSAGLKQIGGIEITARSGTTDVHVLGYSQQFAQNVLTDGLAATRAGYAERIQTMVERCHQAGYNKVSFADIAATRQHQTNPSFISYDVVKELQRKHYLTHAEALKLTVRNGPCYVPYGDWTLALADAIELLHAANAIAVLAHPGIIAYEATENALTEVLAQVIEHHIDGLEVYHPFHDAATTEKLQRFAFEHTLVITAGSDWHGPGRYHDDSFGLTGLSETDYTAFMDRLPL
jgi:predicted metal-dependent phosphoesterase TrpH